ncbi:hypothetical protein [Paraburkholderia sediminicola]
MDIVLTSDASAVHCMHRASPAEIEEPFGDVMSTSEIIHLPLR